MSKKIASVLAHFTFDKKVIPFKILYRDGTKLTVDRIVDTRPAASLRAGGSGMRYICNCTAYYEDCEVPVNGVHLFRDDDEWFTEEDITDVRQI